MPNSRTCIPIPPNVVDTLRFGLTTLEVASRHFSFEDSAGGVFA